MSSIRILATAAAVMATALMADVVGTAAQTSTAPGKPIQLVPVVERPGAVKSVKTVKPKIRVKSVAKRHHVATKMARRVPVPAKVSAVTAIAAVVPADPPIDPALAFAEPTPGVVTFAGQSVEVASPDDVNDIDRAADTPDKLVHRDIAAAVPVPVPVAAAPAPVASPAAVIASAHAAVIAPSPTIEKAPANPDTSWMAELLASLGGAIAAASAVAWFLIASAPRRGAEESMAQET